VLQPHRRERRARHVDAVAGARDSSVVYPSGAQFTVALTCALVTGAADSDVTEVAANEVMWSIAYR
jgi:hypothetical protein